MTSQNSKIEVLSGPERRRRWTTAEKVSIVQEAYKADAAVTIVARRHGIQPNQLLTWRKLAVQGALVATAAEEDVVPASEYRALQNQVRELQCLLGKKTMEGEILKDAAQTVIDQLPIWFEYSNRFHPHKTLGYRSPKELLADKIRQPSFIGSI